MEISTIKYVYVKSGVICIPVAEQIHLKKCFGDLVLFIVLNRTTTP